MPARTQDKPPSARLMTLGVIIMIAAAVFFSLVQHFVLTLPRITNNPDGADGIVVTTGGQNRLRAGLDLLSDGKAPHLLLSGVGQGITKEMISQSLGLNSARADKLACCVALDFQAKDTKGNALAAKKWADSKTISTILLVTSDYHMPRAQLEFAHQMPGRMIIAYPVLASDLDGKSWYSDWQTLRLYSREFLKYSFRRAALLVMA